MEQNNNGLEMFLFTQSARSLFNLICNKNPVSFKKMTNILNAKYNKHSFDVLIICEIFRYLYHIMHKIKANRSPNAYYV